VSWLIWGVLLVLQQSTQTWTMRVRNTDRVRENAIASVCSNGVWIVSLTLAVSKVTEGVSILIVAPFYVCFTVLGSVWMHWWLLKRDAKTHNWMRKPAR
jgi:O-antigen/teichoic acid export membrane protein